MWSDRFGESLTGNVLRRRCRARRSRWRPRSSRPFRQMGHSANVLCRALIPNLQKDAFAYDLAVALCWRQRLHVITVWACPRLERPPRCANMRLRGSDAPSRHLSHPWVQEVACAPEHSSILVQYHFPN